MFLVGYLAVLLSVQFIYCIVQARTVQVMYVDNRNYPGGPWQYFLDTQYLAINVIFDATLFIQTFLCDLLVVRLTSSRLTIVLNAIFVTSFGDVTSSGLFPVPLLPSQSLHCPRSCSSHPSVRANPFAVFLGSHLR